MKKQKQKSPKNRAMQEKVTASLFFSIHRKIIRELMHKYPFETDTIILSSCVLLRATFVELEFLEYITNSVSAHSNGAYSFRTLSAVVGLFFAALLVLWLLRNGYNQIKEKYVSNIALKVEKEINGKLSAISYEYYESNAFHEKIRYAPHGAFCQR